MLVYMLTLLGSIGQSVRLITGPGWVFLDLWIEKRDNALTIKLYTKLQSIHHVSSTINVSVPAPPPQKKEKSTKKLTSIKEKKLNSLMRETVLSSFHMLKLWFFIIPLKDE